MISPPSPRRAAPSPRRRSSIRFARWATDPTASRNSRDLGQRPCSLARRSGSGPAVGTSARLRFFAHVAFVGRLRRDIGLTRWIRDGIS